MYIELHSRSAFSFLEGSSLPESLIARCAELQMPAMALLDRDGVYGAPRFHLAAKKAGLMAHIGAEVTCALNEARARTPAPPKHKHGGGAGVLARINSSPTHMDFGDAGVPARINSRNTFRLPLLISSRTGYQNLCRLITKMKLRNKKDEGAAFDYELEEHAEGLICLTGGDNGPIATALRSSGIDEAKKSVERLIEIFGRQNVYVELQRHFCREQELRNRAAIEI